MPDLSRSSPHTKGGQAVKVVRLAIVLAFIGLLLCLWLLLTVNWYTFVAFMMLAQPLLLLAVLVFAIAFVRDLRQKGVL